MNEIDKIWSELLKGCQDGKITTGDAYRMKSTLQDQLTKYGQSERKLFYEKLETLYSKIEQELPPLTLNKFEQVYNDGLHKGQLKAMERICVDILEIDGDKLQSLTKES